VRFICTNCSYVYDPKNGDPMNHIAPGTDFEELPDEWCCPICYVSTDEFDPLD